MNNLENTIEAILFFKGEPISIKKLSELLKVTEEETKQALNNLENSLSNRGLALIFKDNDVALATRALYSEIINNIKKEELNRDLSKASLETLSIILYRNGASRSEIDFVRGVNSSFTLRALAIRGLVEKVVSNEDNRKFIYKPTFDLLSFMGVSKVEDLPNYNEVNSNIKNTINELEEENKIENNG
jgi:segregation and condensation protein B